jgi:hypothetical protein
MKGEEKWKESSSNFLVAAYPEETNIKMVHS